MKNIFSKKDLESTQMMRPIDKDMHYKERKMMFFRLKEHDPIGT